MFTERRHPRNEPRNQPRSGPADQHADCRGLADTGVPCPGNREGCLLAWGNLRRRSREAEGDRRQFQHDTTVPGDVWGGEATPGHTTYDTSFYTHQGGHTGGAGSCNQRPPPRGAQHLRAQVNAVNTRISKCALRHGLQVINIHKRLCKQQKHDRMLKRDGVHLTPAALDVCARLWRSAVGRAMKHK